MREVFKPWQAMVIYIFYIKWGAGTHLNVRSIYIHNQSITDMLSERKRFNYMNSQCVSRDKHKENLPKEREEKATHDRMY